MSTIHGAFIPALAGVLRQHPLAEKLVLVPSYRIGQQWLDRAARHSGGFVNTRPVTMRRLMLDYAGSELESRRLTVPGQVDWIRLAGQSLDRLRQEHPDLGYFSSLPPSLDLAMAVASALRDLDAAGITQTDALEHRVRPLEKARELVRMARYFRELRNDARLAGAEDIYAAAVRGMARHDGTFPFLIVTAEQAGELSGFERQFFQRWPADRRLSIQHEAGTNGERPRVTVTSSPSVMAEAMDVWRRILAEGTALDGVEIICMDASASVTALVHSALTVFRRSLDELPVTLAPGLPVASTRAGRLLTAWLEWLDAGRPSEGLARMLDNGLVPALWRTRHPDVSLGAMASLLRALPINGDPEQYDRQLHHIAAGAMARPAAVLAEFVMSIIPDDGSASPRPMLVAAERLLDHTAHGDGKADAYGRSALREALQTWQKNGDWSGFDPRLWLERAVRDMRVMGTGPVPGAAFVSAFPHGGHSGRPYTFIVGFDDSRLPGSSRQDPVLLDRDRQAVSSQLPVSGQRTRQRLSAWRELAERLAGRVWISYAEMDGDRRQHLAPAVKDLPIDEGLRTRSPHAAGLPETVPAAPSPAAPPLTREEAAISFLLPTPRHRYDLSALHTAFPDLVRGGQAEAARESSRFTEFDGWAPEAGADLVSVVLSPTDMELLASCPLAFFFKRCLGILPPERYQVRPGRWLPGNQRGNLLHDLFQHYLDALDQPDGKSAADPAAGADLLWSLLDAAVEKYKRLFPPHDLLAGWREEKELGEAAAIFLVTEQERRREGRPLYREVALGGTGEPRTPWDRPEPVALPLTRGGVLDLRGRIDRIDRLHRGGLVIYDYKTGRSDDYASDNPFRQGRHLQPYLYIRMLAEALSAMGKPEPIESFAYFFPMPRDEGKTVRYRRIDLESDGQLIIERLATMARNGLFPFTTDHKDVLYSEYAPLFGDVGGMTAAAQNKALANPVLSDWAALRELSTGDEGDD